MTKVTVYISKSGLKTMNWNYFLKYTGFWFIINSLVGLIISYFISLGLESPFILLLLGAEISTHCISGSAALSGYILNRSIQLSSQWKQLFLVNFVAVASAFIGREISLLCARVISEFPGMSTFHNMMLDISEKLTIAIIILTVLISTIVLIIQQQRAKGRALRDELHDIKERIHQAEISEKQKTVISFREQGSHYRVDYRDIIYLSSKRKKTLIHTEDRDYEINNLIKEMEPCLPSEYFFRLHKQFIVNLLYIKKLQYYEGGRYNLYLNDEDETIIPVGKKYTPQLKEKLHT